jgi:hypothetical protein
MSTARTTKLVSLDGYFPTSLALENGVMRTDGMGPMARLTCRKALQYS